MSLILNKSIKALTIKLFLLTSLETNKRHTEKEREGGRTDESI